MAEALAYEASSRRAGKDPTGLTRTLVVWLWLGMAGSACAIANSVEEIWALSSLDPATPMSAWSDTPSAGLAVDLLVGLSGLFQFLVWLGAAFLSLKWIYRAALNSRALSGAVRVSPPWAIGWYFVPVACLWKPFQAMKEAWATGTRPDAWTSVDTPSLLRWWWGLWLVNNIAGNIALRLWMRAGDAGELSASAVVSIAAEAVNFPLSLVFIQVVRQVATRQQAALQGRTVD